MERNKEHFETVLREFDILVAELEDVSEAGSKLEAEIKRSNERARHLRDLITEKEKEMTNWFRGKDIFIDKITGLDPRRMLQCFPI